MSQFGDLYQKFNEAVFKIASVWRTQQSAFNDPKIEEIGISIIQPVSDTSRLLNTSLDEMDRILAQMKQIDIVDDV